jgi:hypothetical protein
MTLIWGHPVVKEKTKGTVNYTVLWFMVADSSWAVDEITYFYKAEILITIFSETSHLISIQIGLFQKNQTFMPSLYKTGLMLSPYIIVCQQNLCIKLSSFNNLTFFWPCIMI